MILILCLYMITSATSTAASKNESKEIYEITKLKGRLTIIVACDKKNESRMQSKAEGWEIILKESSPHNEENDKFIRFEECNFNTFKEIQLMLHTYRAEELMILMACHGGTNKKSGDYMMCILKIDTLTDKIFFTMKDNFKQILFYTTACGSGQLQENQKFLNIFTADKSVAVVSTCPGDILASGERDYWAILMGQKFQGTFGEQTGYGTCKTAVREFKTKEGNRIYDKKNTELPAGAIYVGEVKFCGHLNVIVGEKVPLSDWGFNVRPESLETFMKKSESRCRWHNEEKVEGEEEKKKQFAKVLLENGFNSNMIYHVCDTLFNQRDPVKDITIEQMEQMKDAMYYMKNNSFVHGYDLDISSERLTRLVLYLDVMMQTDTTKLEKLECVIKMKAEWNAHTVRPIMDLVELLESIQPETNKGCEEIIKSMHNKEKEKKIE